MIVVLIHAEAEKLFAQLLSLVSGTIPIFTIQRSNLVLTYLHTMFEETPTILLCTLIHDTKEQEAHDELVKVLKKYKLIEQRCILVMDGELALSNAFIHVFPSLRIVRCHNHFNQDIKAWLRKNFNVHHRVLLIKIKQQYP
ncbi:unnamed protein product [Didymodactylos carnosus]|uniref:MULE transposase domain-containing protein n=1 Tax=Didymodactylos carnosus TaxID=1234261 RepID=A0A8S2DZI8_9BILA|nr:unnamed protein product [Didymodactylos carnosus]CAF3840139.1 unnamed protein product [Didymodactylos carnosus]